MKSTLHYLITISLIISCSLRAAYFSNPGQPIRSDVYGVHSFQNPQGSHAASPSIFKRVGCILAGETLFAGGLYLTAITYLFFGFTAAAHESIPESEQPSKKKLAIVGGGTALLGAATALSFWGSYKLFEIAWS